MKHHEYQIYYGGFKIKLKDVVYCKECNAIVVPDNTKFPKTLKRNVRSHKK